MNFFGKAQGGYDFLVNVIIRPPRNDYVIEDLGPTKFTMKGRVVERKDFEITNERGLKLKCSHFIEKPEREQPCVIYLHGNCGSRADGARLIKYIIPSGYSLFCFDFSGSGQSEGEYISLGHYERYDVRAVVNYLRESPLVSTIGIWGRSMGAATAIMYAAEDPSIAGIVLDSPFSSLTKLAEELASNSASSVVELPIKLEKFAVQLGLKVIRKSVQTKANFDIFKLSPIDYVGSCFIPALFAHGEDDDFILPSHCKLLYEQYNGEKNLILMEGNHNSERPQFFHDSVLIFFNNIFNVGNSNISDDNGDENQPSAPMGLPKMYDHLIDFDETDEEMIQRAIALSLELENQPKSS